MVDRLRAYRRWRVRRLGLLVPVFLASLGTQLWLAAGSAAPAWLRIVSLGASGLVLALIGFFLAQTLLCARLHEQGNRAGARAVREQLAPSGSAALAAAVLLGVLNLIPYLVPADPGKVPADRSARVPLRFLPLDAAPTAPPEIHPGPVPEIATGPMPASPSPDARPIPVTLPLHLAVEETPDPPEIPATFAFLDGHPQDPAKSPAPEGEEGYPRYRPDVQDGFRLDLETEGLSVFLRLGVPQESHPDEWVPPEVRLALSFLNGRERADELSVLLDIPISRHESLRAAIAVGRISREEYLEETPTESWERVTLTYTHRLVGHTARAPFDLAFSVGITVDRYQLQGADGPIDPAARLSPYVAVDAALWQQSTASLLLHAGYSAPVNATGASSGVLELSATLRIDLTETISLQAGYRYLVLRLRDYEDAFIGSRSSAALSDSFTGPVVGIDIRF